MTETINVQGHHQLPTIYFHETLTDRLGEGSLTAASVHEQLSKLLGTEEIVVRIHSRGGEFLQAFAIHEILRRWEGEVTAIVDGLACGAATLLLAAADRALIVPAGHVMVRCPYMVATGDAKELRRCARMLSDTEARYVAAMILRWRHGEDALRVSMAEERWFNAEEAVETGLVDGIAGETSS